MSDSRDRRSGEYGSFWDTYVIDRFPEIQAGTPHAHRKLESWRVLNTTDENYDWPGDEWGDKETATRLLDETLSDFLNGEPQVLCELGPGAGRYTVLALERFPGASVLSFDVSSQFDRTLRERCADHVSTDRLQTFILDEDPLRFVRTVEQRGLLGKVDGIFSFDAMVHVDLHTLFVYWLSAARMLRPGGSLAMNVADACSENGFMKLMNDAPGVFALRGSVGGHFMWLSREVVKSTLERLGFDVDWRPGNLRDLFFHARLVEPDKHREWLDRPESRWFVGSDPVD